ncbi:polypyrimidine tract-binding protein 1-like isoform X2 [Asterias rubens]|uniref:polypyrimidine tract-binding protein 1-like isoform X2 n=1 Tax=Asterias rubens TaxID=7604 RepID=UPI0014554416|nr:polypyrimidine tract-binding protein 1-like isoform X2 [Asterias rubens]
MYFVDPYAGGEMILAPSGAPYGTVPLVAVPHSHPAANYVYSSSTRKRGLRGSDELFTPNGTTTNPLASTFGGGDSPINDAKKVKREAAPPSRVVHIRNLAPDVNEAEVVSLGVPFGTITKVLCIRNKGQAFIELADVSQSTKMISYYNQVTTTLHGKPVFVQFSTHQELKTDNSPAHQTVAVQAALAAVNAVLNNPSSSGTLLPDSDSYSGNLDKNTVSNVAAQAALQATQALLPQHQFSSISSSPKVADSPGGPQHVLRAVIEHMIYPVNVDTLHQIFSKYGTILKVVTFTKNNVFQALIQFNNSKEANDAKIALDGQNIYNACCTLHIEFSKLPALVVKYNNEKSRDYTRDLPTGDGIHPGDGIGLGGHGMMSNPFSQIASMGQSPFSPTAATLAGFPAAAVPGFGSAFIGGGMQQNAAAAAALRFQNTLAMQGLHGMQGMQGMQSMQSMQSMHNMQGTPVLLVSNLNTELVTPQALFTLFGVYGDVKRVKILYEKRDNALIQMADAHQAQTALANLNSVKLFGKQLRVAPSKYREVAMPREGQPDAGLTKDYNNSPLHRFKKPGSKNFQNIFPPSATLHLSNIPASVTEDDLQSAFSQHGSVVSFKFFPKDRRMALIQMNSVEESTHALIAQHNCQLSESNHLRVSFSKTQMS